MEERTRRETLVTLLTLATNDSTFLSRVRTDTESTLWWYGLALNPAEMDLVRHHLGENANLSDEEYMRQLASQMNVERW